MIPDNYKTRQIKRYKKFKLITITLLLASISSLTQASTYNIQDLGADISGNRSCTEIINKAIKNASSEGGGTIYFPAGKYLTASIIMESNITLHIEAGAELIFSTFFEDYLPFVKIRYEGVFMKSFTPLIYAVNCHNLTIKGEGTLTGNGNIWWEAFNQYRGEVKQYGEVQNPNKLHELWREENKNLMEAEAYDNAYGQSFFRPPFIQFLECTKINIEGLTFRNSPFWTINPVGCEDINIRNIRVINPEEGPNTDGINPSSCKNVRISDCLINVGDDCITIKSGKNKDGRNYARASENITITNCIMLAGHGGVVIGSEMSGGVKNIVISNCIFDGTDNGIRLKSARGRGGSVESIRINNIIMRDIQRNAFIFNLYYDKHSEPEIVSERTPIFRNIHISNITGYDINSAGFILGIEEMPVSDLSFTDINLQTVTGLSVKLASNIEFHDIELSCKEGQSFSFNNCNEIILDNIKSTISNEKEVVIEVTDSKNLLVKNCCLDIPTDAFIKSHNSDITFKNNILNAN